MTCNQITAAITASESARMRPIKTMPDPFNPTGSTAHVRFNTSKMERWDTDARRCQINRIIFDSD